MAWLAGREAGWLLQQQDVHGAVLAGVIAPCLGIIADRDASLLAKMEGMC